MKCIEEVELLLGPIVDEMMQAKFDQMSKLRVEWKDYLLNSVETASSRILKSFSQNIKNLDYMLENYIQDTNAACVAMVAALVSIFGIVVAWRLRCLNLTQFLIIWLEMSPDENPQKILASLLRTLEVQNVAITNNISLVNILNQYDIIGQIDHIYSYFDRNFIAAAKLLRQKQLRSVNVSWLLDQPFLASMERELNNLQLYALTDLDNYLLTCLRAELEQQSDRIVSFDNNGSDFRSDAKESKNPMTKKDLLDRTHFDLDEKIYVAEGQDIEYKQFGNLDTRQIFILKKTVSAMLNAIGGTIFIGIDDNLTVKGFQLQKNLSQDHYENLLEQQCFSQLHPKLRSNTEYQINFIEVRDRNRFTITNLKVLKLTLFCPEKRLDLYTFNQFSTEFQSDSTYCFLRVNDEAKAIRHCQLKAMSVQIRQNQIKDPSMGVPKSKPPRSARFETIHAYVSPVQEKQRSKRLDTCIVQRKSKCTDLVAIYNVINCLKEDSLPIKKVQSASSVLLIEFSQECLENFVAKLQEKLTNQDYNLKIGYSNLLTLKRREISMNENNICADEEKMLTQWLGVNNIHNSSVVRENNKLCIKSSINEQLVQIYKLLRLERIFKVGWYIDSPIQIKQRINQNV